MSKEPVFGLEPRVKGVHFPELFGVLSWTGGVCLAAYSESMDGSVMAAMDTGRFYRCNNSSITISDQSITVLWWMDNALELGEVVQSVMYGTDNIRDTTLPYFLKYILFQSQFGQRWFSRGRDQSKLVVMSLFPITRHHFDKTYPLTGKGNGNNKVQGFF